MQETACWYVCLSVCRTVAFSLSFLDFSNNETNFVQTSLLDSTFGEDVRIFLSWYIEFSQSYCPLMKFV